MTQAIEGLGVSSLRVTKDWYIHGCFPMDGLNQIPETPFIRWLLFILLLN
jgi:hypothetical protein